MADRLVLVWNKNKNAVRIHEDGGCPTLANSRTGTIPPISTQYDGPGTAGWLPLDQAKRLPGAVLCQRCM
jgi:hypothetical protein